MLCNAQPQPEWTAARTASSDAVLWCCSADIEALIWSSSCGFVWLSLDRSKDLHHLERHVTDLLVKAQASACSSERCTTQPAALTPTKLSVQSGSLILLFSFNFSSGPRQPVACTVIITTASIAPAYSDDDQRTPAGEFYAQYARMLLMLDFMFSFNASL